MSRSARWALLAVVVFAIVFVWLDLDKLYALRYGADTGGFTQSFVNLVQHGTTANQYEYQPHLSIHDSWTMIAALPFLALFPRAETMLIIQVLLVAGAGLLLYRFARDCGCTGVTAALLALAYLLSPMTQELAYDNVTENAYVPLLAFALAIALRRRALLTTVIAAQLLLGVKEDQAGFLLWIGAWAAIWYDRRLGLIVAALAIVNGVGYRLIDRAYGYAPNIPSYQFIPVHPLDAAVSLLSLLVPFAFAPLFVRWRVLLAVPFVVELAFNRPWASDLPLYAIGSHYVASLTALCAIGAAVVCVRMPAFARWAPGLALVFTIVSGTTVVHPGRYPYIVDASAYRVAEVLRDSGQSARLTRNDEGAYAVAGANVHVALSLDAATPGGAGWNHDGAAFRCYPWPLRSLPAVSLTAIAQAPNSCEARGSRAVLALRPPALHASMPSLQQFSSFGSGVRVANPNVVSPYVEIPDFPAAADSAGLHVFTIGRDYALASGVPLTMQARAALVRIGRSLPARDRARLRVVFPRDERGRYLAMFIARPSRRDRPIINMCAQGWTTGCVLFFDTVRRTVTPSSMPFPIDS